MLLVTRPSSHTISRAGQIFAHHPSCSLCAAAVCSAVCWHQSVMRNTSSLGMGCLNIPNILHWRCYASNRSAWASCRIPGPVARVWWLVGSGGCDQPMLRPRVLGAGPCHDCPRPQSGGTPRPRHTASYCAELQRKYKYYLDLVGGKFLCQRVDTHS